MSESENETRRKRIDTRLRSALLNWKIISWKSDLDTSSLDGCAVREYPTASGPADYALFVKGQLLGIIEAKRLAIGAENVIEQAKRYSRTVVNRVGDWRGYGVPFLYSSNGELIFYLDVRKKGNITHEVSDFHSPQALEDKLRRDTKEAEKWFKDNPIQMIETLRDYQVRAVESIEDALVDGKRTILLAMATGTGKTVTVVSLIYRLLRSGYAKRVLFLVDRRVLAAQAVTAIAAFQTPDGMKLDKEYEIYSQKFRRDDLDESIRFNPEVLPEDYLTNPQEKHTFVYVSTIQRMVLNLFGKEAFDSFEYDVEARKLDIPIHAFDVIIADECHRGYSARETGAWQRAISYFDAVKIGLTATPAAHTMAVFKHKVSSYSTEEAVADGWLVDYDAVKISSDVHINGAFLKEGELVGEVDTETGAEIQDFLEDEREFHADRIEKDVTAPKSTTKIIESIKEYADDHEKEYQRFPKILIFADNDLPHTSHADEVVHICKEVFGEGDDFVQKITGSPTVDRPLQKIRQFRNRSEPKIVVTVDMLSTGVDIPAIEFIVFMRVVKSRILWVQMLGRGTRLCDDIHKEKFTIFDCLGGSLIEYFKNATDFNVSLQKDVVPISEIIERIYDNRDREYSLRVLIKRLRRIERTMSAEAREEFAKFIPEGDMKKFTDDLRDNLEKDFTGTMKLLRNKDFQKLLVEYKHPKRPFFRGYDTEDTVETEIMFRVGGDYQKPEDYLKAFERFVRDNPDHIEAIAILLSRPKSWNTDALEELRNKLKQSDFDERNLQEAHKCVYDKPLADIISMIKHASDFGAPILNAEERISIAMQGITEREDFTDEQLQWLSYIRQHLVENLAIAEKDFETMPVFERHGGLVRAKEVFGEGLNELITRVNSAVAV
jgi:type I restriction enzyme R subunit